MATTIFYLLSTLSCASSPLSSIVISSIHTITVSKLSSLLNLNMMNVIKFMATNYLMWNRQAHAMLDGYDLVRYLTAHTLCHLQPSSSMES